MNDTERVIGKLEEFREWAKDEFRELKIEVKSLNQLKWKITGGAAVIAVFVDKIWDALRG